jgi:large subunit ribosomal protein L29
MTGKQIREKETAHLNSELLDQQRHLYDLRSQAVTEKLEDPSQLRKTKKDIARIKTILRERELTEAKKTEKTNPEPKSEKTTKEKPAPKKKAPARAKKKTESAKA